nr:polyphosphate kinase 1 [Gemmatimonadota bacterium]
GKVRELWEVELQLDADAAPDLADALAEEFGLEPVTAVPIVRARTRVAQSVSDAAHEVAVLAMDAGEVALLREGPTLRVPVAAGTGEESCRALLRERLGGARGRLRRLALLPATDYRPSMEVWLAERVRRDETASGVEWRSLSSVLSAAGTPALQDRRTLAALQVAARSDVPAGDAGRDDGADRGRTGATVAVRVDERRESTGDSLPRGSLLNMELSTLAFNRRVLVLAEDPRTPLLERIRFVSIFGANLDEFFRVRVAGFKRQVASGSTKPTMDGALPAEQLDAIRIRGRQLAARAYDLLERVLLPALTDHGIEILHPDDLDDEDRAHLLAYYRGRVHPLLTPLAIGARHPFPHIRNLRPALAVTVRASGEAEERLTVLELPGELPRFIALPEGQRLVPLEDVIRACLRELYPGMEVVRAELFRVTRSAELRLSKGQMVEDYLEMVEEQLEKRPFRPVVRLEVERSMPEATRALLLRELQMDARNESGGLGEEDVYTVRGLLDLRGLREIAALPFPALHYTPLERRTPITPDRPFFEAMQEGELLLHFPYDSFEATVERFIVEAAEDPAVASIELALYRTDRRSRIVEALRRASEQGKRVVALVELTARFDEQRNIEWARYLQAAGIHVIYGVPGLKIHAKVALVTRTEGDSVRRYAYLGTGNLNAATAGAYTDLGLLTTAPDLTGEADALFNLLVGNSAEPDFQTLLVAPYNMRRRFLEMIDRETELAGKGRAGHIRVKVNGLADREVIDRLYRASQAGVRVELIVRGICSLRPGVAGLSENIRVYSILGRFLEHARIYYFAGGGEPEYYVGSADWRTRNLSRRVEIATPVREAAHRERLRRLLDEQLADPDSWELGSDGSYYRRPERAPHAANQE